MPYGGRGRSGVNINGKVLEMARAARGLSLEEASRGIVSRQALHHWEKGTHRPTLQNLKRVCDRLRIPVGNVLVEEDVPHTGLAS